MRPLYLLLIIFLSFTPAYAAISTTTNYIDQDFDGAVALCTADLDRDGDIDVLGAAYDADDVVWWENNGSQSFTKRTIDADFDGANSVFAIDMDRDGDIDVLATADVADDVTWWENDGSPSDGGWTKYTIDASFDGANSVFAIDMDKDGDIDVLATANVDDDVAWWENDGNPKKNSWTNQYNVDASFDGANSIFAIDMDKDGDIDVLATADVDDDVAWWENDGNPKKNSWTNQYNVDASFDGANSIFAIDMDKDGDIDVLSSAGTADDVSWWENDGNPKKNTWTEYTIDGDFDGANSISVIDLDFDGNLDIISSADVADDLSWWKNDGSPKKNNWTEYAIRQDFDGAVFVYAADLDRDGDIDILSAANVADDIAWWKNDANRQSGNVGFLSEKNIADSFNGASSVYAADVDIDGDIDILTTASLADDIILWKNDGSPTDGGWVQLVIDSNFDGAYDATAKDLDRDGDIDIIAVANNADTLAWWQNNGSLSFTKNTIASDLNGANSVFVIDLDRDGDFDIVTAAGLADTLAWWQNNGSQGFTKNTIATDFNGITDIFCVDLDRDGDIDIIATADVDDDVAWWQNNGSMSFTKLTIDSNLNGATSVAANDLDKDGDLDIVAAAYNGDQIAWYKNDGSPGDGGWLKYSIDGDAGSPTSVVALDIDQDGDIDVVGSAKISDDIAWWENDGTPSDDVWTKRVIDTNFDGAISVFSIDVDRDGEIDIVGAAENGDDISWWEDGGSSAVTSTTATQAATPFINVDWTTLTAPTSTEGTATTPSGTLGVTGLEESQGTEAAVQEIDVKCFIATASFGTPYAKEIRRLVSFRDRYLIKNRFGRLLIKFYYKISPPIAKIISKSELLKMAVRAFIRLIAGLIPADDAYAEEPKEADELTVGVITLSPPESYVVIEEEKTKIRRLYKEDDYKKLKDKNLKFVQSVIIDTIEYRYKPVKGKVEFIATEFELVEIKDKRAVLKKAYIEEPQASMPMEEEAKEEAKEPEAAIETAEEKPQEKPLTRRLIAGLFLKIETKKIKEFEWEVSLPSTLEAASNFGEVLGVVIKKIGELLEPEKQAKIYFDTSLGKGTLSRDGLLVESLNSTLKAKSGIKDDDLITSVNGKNLTTIQDIAAIFSSLSGSPQSFTVKIVRDDKELTHIYYLK